MTERPSPAATHAWVISRWAVLALALALWFGLWVAPDRSLGFVWYVLVPLLPASFLLSTELWRNVCPIATLNVATGSRGAGRRVGARGDRVAASVGVVLLALLVPARTFVLDVNGPALATVLLVVAVLALLGGTRFQTKSGFCNAICPVLPVERLYGQRPLLNVRNARCSECRGCSSGCLDLIPERALVRRATSRRIRLGWEVTPYGAFALAFPGFVIAYHQLGVVAPPSWEIAYSTVGLGSVVSWITLTASFRMLRLEAQSALLVSAGLAVGLYYWFAPMGIANHFGLSDLFVTSARFGAVSFVACWLALGLRSRGRRRPSARRAGALPVI